MSMLCLSVRLVAHLVLANGASEASLDRAVEVRSMSLLQMQKSTAKKVPHLRLLQLFQSRVVITERVQDLEAADTNASTDLNSVTPMNVTSLGIENLESRPSALPVADAFIAESDHHWHMLKQSPPLLGGGVANQGDKGAPLATNEVAAVPERTAEQLVVIFLAVFLAVSLSWIALVVGTKLFRHESLQRCLQSFRLLIHCFCLCACSWGMIAANKHLMMELQAPGIIAAAQFVIGVVTASLSCICQIS